MTWHTSIWLFQAVHAIGLSLWLTIAALNNWQAFRGSIAAVGGTMSMAALKQPPAIETPLSARAKDSIVLHRMALLLVLALQILAALTCLTGTYQLIIARDLATAQSWLNLGLSGFAAFLFAMHLGGLWFGYWIRQESLQLTHLALLIWILLAFLLFNVPLA